MRNLIIWMLMITWHSWEPNMPTFQCVKCSGILYVSVHHFLGNRLKMKCEEQGESLYNYYMQRYTRFSVVILSFFFYCFQEMGDKVKRIIFGECGAINMHEHFSNYCGNCFVKFILDSAWRCYNYQITREVPAILCTFSHVNWNCNIKICMQEKGLSKLFI